MESSSGKGPLKSSGVRRVNGVAIRTLSVNESIAEALRGWPTNSVVRIVKTSKRTVENWKQARTGPQAKHIAAMMADDELCAAILPALGRPELAHSQRLLTAERNLAALKTLNQRISSAKAAENRHERESNGIRKSLGLPLKGGALDGRSSQPLREPVAPRGGVVPRSTDE